MKRFFTTLAFLFPLLVFAQGSTGLVAHWDFNGTVNDVSGNGHHGTNFGTVPAAGITGTPNTARYFDGIDDHIDVPYQPQFNLVEMTILAYVKVHSFYNGTCQGNYIVSKGHDYTTNSYFLAYSDNATDNSCFNYDPTVQRFYGATNGNSTFGTNFWSNGGINPIVDTGVWYCVATTYDGDTMKLYVNGAYVAFMPWADQYSGPEATGLGIGYHRQAVSSYPYWIHATVDDIRIYNRALSQAEIASYCDSVNFVPAPLPTGSLNNTSICPGEEAFLVFNATGGTGPYTLTFTTGSGTFTVSGVQSGVPFSVGSPATTTTYTLTTLTDATGAVNSAPGATATVTVSTSVANAGPDVSICGPGSVTLNGSGGGTYQWIPATGLSDPTISNPVATVNVTTTYALQVTTPGGCVDTDTVVIHVLASSMADAGPDTTLCGPGSITLNGSGGTSYQWTPATGLSHPNIHNPVATVDATTTYILEVTTADGCKAIDSVLITVVQPGSFYADSVAYLCPGDSVQLHAAGGDTYLWMPATGLSDPTAPAPWANPADDITYQVAISSLFCDVYDTLTVRVERHGYPTIQAASSNDLDCGQTFSQLVASGGVSYVWTPAAGLESITGASTIARPDTTTTYLVYGTDQYGCTGKTVVTVKVLQDGNSRIQAPTAFTPNNDGINDCWRVNLPGVTTTYQLLIFNRWGQQVFSTTDAHKCWDGYFNGVPQPVGTYVYYFKGKNNYCGKVEGKGNFHLLR